MMKELILILHLFVFTFSHANDGAYYASGNQLIPIKECDISIQKEILSIKKIGDFIYVTVDYTFYNPVDKKTILVGFEAPPPGGEAHSDLPENGGHPYIHNFKVLMNGKQLNYNKAIVNEEKYYQNGKVNAKTFSEIEDEITNFYYVYYFKAKFKKGINKIIHTYKFNVSSSVMDNYNFDYILTAANRWANDQIDDFTLNIDMGKKQHFDIKNSFCTTNDWLVKDGRKFKSRKENWTSFVTNRKRIIFKQKDFHPKGELHLMSPRDWISRNYEVFDAAKNDLPSKIFNYYGDGEVSQISTKSANEKSLKILRNLPFAHKGYIFKTPFIQEYYLKQNWYYPNPKYKTTGLSGKTLEWYHNVLENK